MFYKWIRVNWPVWQYSETQTYGIKSLPGTYMYYSWIKLLQSQVKIIVIPIAKHFMFFYLSDQKIENAY